MQAKLLSQNSNARNYANAKEQIGYYKLIAFAQDTFHELVDVRVYAGRSRSASTVYASIWIHSKDYYTSGTGRAGGGRLRQTERCHSRGNRLRWHSTRSRY